MERHEVQALGTALRRFHPGLGPEESWKAMIAEIRQKVIPALHDDAFTLALLTEQPKP